jgi:hypothetical protein
MGVPPAEIQLFYLYTSNRDTALLSLYIQPRYSSPISINPAPCFRSGVTLGRTYTVFVRHLFSQTNCPATAVLCIPIVGAIWAGSRLKIVRDGVLDLRLLARQSSALLHWGVR